MGINDPKMPVGIISQHVARVMLDKLIVKATLSKESGTSGTACSYKLSIDEEQAVRYAGGFVIRSVKAKISKMPDSSRYINILDAMHEDGSTSTSDDDETDDFLAYTKKWITIVDRGGLYKVSNETFLLFYWLELTIRKYLHGHNIDISKAIEEILNCENILAYWSMICNDNLEADESDMLLAKIAELWLTLRGFSYTSNLLEQYKQLKGSIKKKSLRKSLRRQPKFETETGTEK